MKAACGGLLLAAAGTAIAGQSCETAPMTLAEARTGLALAEAVQARLDASGSDVAVVARVGQDLSKYGLFYSHAGVVWRSAPGAPWRVVHLLNDCGTAHSDLWAQGLGNFFLNGIHAPQAAVLIPPAATAAALKARLQDPLALRALHQPAYSVVAYPYSLRYQNSNQWLLETVATVQSRELRLDNREAAQSWLKLAGYQPTELKLRTLTRLGGRVFKANVAFDDHPNELRFSDRIRTVTVESLERFWTQPAQGWRETTVRVDEAG
ncbi:DUF2145 domain-containing protein [Chitinolyticbacter meiyuanensis]|uniref:DUF2145 domain-containing protein n=1 Tax=Chitinolyticbacter meiyuanensis TaxID=682798 RepID=UPI0011E5DE81|nr:DUF2145 domain-containing protein [Chitinolyticbacter meiyuanensis]